MTLQDPLALLLLLPLAAILLLRRKCPVPTIPFPGVSGLPPLPKTLRQRLTPIIPWLQGVALILMVLALARPQLVNTQTTVSSRGVDIVIALDLSTSMLAVDQGTKDRTRSRLAIAREVTREFITRRTGDRIGFIAFAARPYPVSPLTLDHEWLEGVLERLEVGRIEDGTALGDGILAALNRLRASAAGSRALILLTDGRSNGGKTIPGAAAAAAHTLGIRIYTIGIGATSPALFPVEDPLGGTSWRRVSADLDEATLREVAATTGGKYYRAGDATALRSVFQDIDRLEKRPIEEKRSQSVQELFPPLTLTALLLLMLAQTISCTWLKGLP